MHHRRDHEHASETEAFPIDRIRIHIGGASVPGGLDGVVEPCLAQRKCKHFRGASDHALAALRELRRMLTWIEHHKPHAD